MGRRTNTAVWHDKYKRWQINVQKDGQRRSFYSPTPGRTGQRECNKKADDWLDLKIVSPSTRVGDLYDQWIEELKVTTSKAYYSQYDQYGRNWIKPAVQFRKIGEIIEQDLQDIITAGHKHGLSKKTLCNIRTCITAYMKYARKNRASTLVPENLTIPRAAPVGERTILQPDDLIKLFECDATLWRGKERKELFINAYRFQVATGLRPGEVLGLKKADIAGNKVYIKRSINSTNEETKGKNSNARRTLPLTPLALDILRSQAALTQSIKSEYVFHDQYGDHIHAEAYYKHWVRYRAANGLSEVSPYELRHTFVSVVKELPEGILKPIIGHSKVMDTFGVYSHEVQGDAEQAASLINAAFVRAMKQTKVC